MSCCLVTADSSAGRHCMGLTIQFLGESLTSRWPLCSFSMGSRLSGHCDFCSVSHCMGLTIQFSGFRHAADPISARTGRVGTYEHAVWETRCKCVAGENATLHMQISMWGPGEVGVEVVPELQPCRK